MRAQLADSTAAKARTRRNSGCQRCVESLRRVSVTVDLELESAFADPTSTEVLALEEASLAIHRALLALQTFIS